MQSTSNINDILATSYRERNRPIPKRATRITSLSTTTNITLDGLEEVIEKDLGLALFVALFVLLDPGGKLGELLLAFFVHVMSVRLSEPSLDRASGSSAITLACGNSDDHFARAK